MATLVTEGGRSFIRQYLLDFGSALGSAAVDPREGWEGHEALFEAPGAIMRRVLGLGFLCLDGERWPGTSRRPSGAYRRATRTGIRMLGSRTCRAAPFRHMRADDAFWAARKLTFLTDDMIEAAIREGEFGDPKAEQVLARAIRERRDRILGRYLPALNPVTNPVLEAGSHLRFGNAAVDAGVAKAPIGYRASWGTFDNNTGESSPIAETQAPASPLPVPALPAGDFVRVEIRATGGPPE